MEALSHEPTSTMTVDIRLCGSIPRGELKERLCSQSSGALCTLNSALTSHVNRISTHHSAGTVRCKSTAPTLRTTGAQNENPENINMSDTNEMRGVLQERQPLAPLYDPPSWAVPARGETRLEPVCEGVGRQAPVDLTAKGCLRIGRSPNCDIQLLHGTSSRRHAMLFHHSNGSCYVIDCGSAHGTFVNGVRIASPASRGVVVPHKVRRGAIVRFGGPGAPCFILKSFSFKLSDITECSAESSDMGELVRRNTRVNALGKSAAESVLQGDSCLLYQDMSVCRKRSFDSLDSRDTLDEEPCGKRLRCSSPPLSPEEPLRLVSPDLPSMSISMPRHVTFSLEPPQAFFPSLVTPGDSGEEDNGCF